MSDEELKLAFARNLQSSAATCRPRKGKKNRGGRAYRDTSRGEESLPLSVHPMHVETARRLTKDNGLSGINFQNDGTCVVSDERHKREYMKLTGYYDANSKNGG